MKELHFSRKARANIRDVGNYTEKLWGTKQRDSYLSKLFLSFEKLCKFPFQGRQRDELFKGMRSVTMENHIIYYFIKNNKIFIAAVLPERMDP